MPPHRVIGIVSTVEHVELHARRRAAVEAAFSPAFLAAHGGLGNIDQPFTRNYFTGKFTQQFNASNRMDVRYAYEDNIREGDQVGDPGFAFNRTFSTKRLSSRMTSGASWLGSRPSWEPALSTSLSFRSAISRTSSRAWISRTFIRLPGQP